MNDTPKMLTTRPTETQISIPRVPPATAAEIIADANRFKGMAIQFPLGQSWRAAPEPAFRPASTWLAAGPDSFQIFAELSDAHIATTAVAHHEPLWQLGDVLEVLMINAAVEGYFEFHIAPNGCVLQLKYPQAGLPLALGVAQYVWRAECLQVAVKTEPANERWQVAAVIPVGTLVPKVPKELNGEWRVAFCRYDYDAKHQYCLSSSARLSQPSFHRIGEWPQISVPGGFRT